MTTATAKFTQHANQINELLSNAQHVVIIQADNPDGDSLASALALEEIIGDMNKATSLYCGVDIPSYLRHIKGWDRVSTDMPSKFDLSIIVDTSAHVLLTKLENSKYRSWVASKPVVVLDHHADVVCDIPYATVAMNDNQAVATGELIYKLATQHKWPLNVQAKTHIASSILADSLGLASEGTTAYTYRTMAELVESGVNRPLLEEARRALTKMPEAIFRYKGMLIARTEFLAQGQLAVVSIPQNEINEYSPLYNPAPLVQNDMLQTEGVRCAIVLKNYDDGRVTGSVRCNFGTSIAADLAEHLGGGGHTYAAGFKVLKAKSFDDVKDACITKATELLAKDHKDSSNAPV